MLQLLELIKLASAFLTGAAIAAFVIRANWPPATCVNLDEKNDAGIGALPSDFGAPAHAGCRRLVASERRSRVRVEKLLRDAGNRCIVGDTSSSSSLSPVPPVRLTNQGYPLLPIGRIESAFRGRWGTPRQGLLAPDARAAVVLSAALGPDCVAGLSEYSHVFVLFLFHDNTGPGSKSGGRKLKLPAQSQLPAAEVEEGPAGGELDDRAVAHLLQARPYHACIEAPALGGGKTGVFSTRSPHRPNVIGLSTCRLLAVCAPQPGSGLGPTLVLSGCDLLDGTPVVDVKPCAPYDCPACLEELLLRPAGTGAEACGPLEAQAAAHAPLVSHAEFDPPRDLPAAVASLNAALDLRPPAPPAADGAVARPSTVRGPAWAFASLRDQGSARVAVVWGPGVVEAVHRAIAAGLTVHFGGAALARILGTRPAATSSSEVGSEASALMRAVSQALALDVRAVRHGRGSSRAGGGGATPPLSASAGCDTGATVCRMLASCADESAAWAHSAEEDGKLLPSDPLLSTPPIVLRSPPVPPTFELFYDALYFLFAMRDAGASAGGRAYVHISDVCLAAVTPHRAQHAWSGDR